MIRAILPQIKIIAVLLTLMVISSKPVLYTMFLSATSVFMVLGLTLEGNKYIFKATAYCAVSIVLMHLFLSFQLLYFIAI